MGAKKGNQNARGSKGGGRKSAYEEMKIAEILRDAFVGAGVSKKDLKKTLTKDKIKLIDHTLLKAITSEKVLLGLLKKLVPDKIEDSGTKTVDLSKEACKRIGKYVREKTN